MRSQFRGAGRAKSLVALVVAVGAAGFPASAGAVTLFGSGSSAEQPILNVLFREYSRLHHKVRFSYSPDGGNQGVKDVQSHRSQFAVNTRPPLPSDAGTTYIKIFLDGLCIAVNPHNSISNLTVSQTANIFLGLDTNWSQVGGSNLSTTIDPIGRNSTAGSYTFFQQAVLNNKTQSSNVVQETSDGLVATAISHDQSAIGYVGLAHSGKGSGVKKLTINGVACTDANIKSNRYPLWRWIWAVVPTPGHGVKANKTVDAFINWVATSKEAGKLISQAGAVPAFNKK